MKKLITILAVFVSFFAKANVSPAIKNSNYSTNESGWKNFQTDYKNDAVNFSGSEKIWLQAIQSRLEKMSGKKRSINDIKSILLSKSVRFGRWQVKNLENSGFDGTQYVSLKLTASSEDDYLEVIIFTDKDSTEYPLLKWTGKDDKPCGNPTRAKKIEVILDEVTWTLSGKQRCNNGVSEVEKVSSDGHSIWVKGGNACPPPCNENSWKLVDQQKVGDTTWGLWRNDCGQEKSGIVKVTSNPIVVDNPVACNCPIKVDAPQKQKKVYNRNGNGFIPQAPYLSQGQMVYVSGQQVRTNVPQNISSPNRGGPTEGNPGSSNPYSMGNTNPTGGNPGVYGTNPYGNTNPIGANPGSSNPYGTGNTNPTGGNPIGG